jgi:hypothetical protein
MARTNTLGSCLLAVTRSLTGDLIFVFRLHPHMHRPEGFGPTCLSCIASFPLLYGKILALLTEGSVAPTFEHLTATPPIPPK